MKAKILIALALLTITFQQVRAKEWRGIVPLKSTRADVERRFGKPDKWGGYQVADETVSFDYSEGPCRDLYQTLEKDNCKCWLAPDTVVSIFVEPTVKRTFSILKLDVTKFTKTPINPFPSTFEYANRIEGVNYTIDESEDEIRHITYYHSASDCENLVKSHAPTYKNSWRGLIPLHANRSDVERLLGKATRTWETGAVYTTDHEILTIRFAKTKCGEPGANWNVSRETVEEFVVGQRFGFLLNRLSLDPQRWERVEILPNPEIAHASKRASYVDHISGIIIETESNQVGEEQVISITYKPGKVDEALRCTSNAARN
jgi:hypothetical protein